MSLVIQFHDALSCPTIVCDWCHQPIEEARQGGYFFPVAPRTEGTMVPITFLHKGSCDSAYSSAHGRLEWWGELGELPTFLARNLHVALPGDVTPWGYGLPQHQGPPHA